MPEPLFSLEMSLADARAAHPEVLPSEIEEASTTEGLEVESVPIEKSVAMGGSDFTFTSGSADGGGRMKDPGPEQSPRRSSRLFP